MRMRNKTLRLIEFLFIGLIMGIVEDLIAVFLVTGERITFRVFWIVFLVALPFAFISEYVVDHPRFWKVLLRLKDSSHATKEEVKKVDSKTGQASFADEIVNPKTEQDDKHKMRELS